MSKRIVLSTAASSRRQPLLQQSDSYRQAGTRLGEAVGGTAAVCCCFSFGIANIVYLAVYKLPTRLCQKMLRNKRHHRRIKSMNDALVPSRRQCICGCCDDIISAGRLSPLCCDDADLTMLWGRNSGDNDKEVVELEREMWQQFYDSGFWRSPSHREDSFSSSQSSTPTARNLQVVLVN